MNAKSSAESEFYGVGEHVADAIFTRSYLLAQGYNFPPATVYQDNQAAIRLSENGVASSSRTRHIDIRYLFIQDRIENGDIKENNLDRDTKATKSPLANHLKVVSKTQAGVVNNQK